MKKTLLLLIITLSFLSFKTNDNKKLLGKWVGNDKSEVGYITFKDDKNAYIEVGDLTFGGENFEVDGEKYNMYYTTNFETTPFELDFIVTEIRTEKQRKMLFLGKFKDDNTLIFAAGFNGERPTSLDGDNTITLTRITE
ncbi:hypothetical protein [Lacinutrix undariae]